jgi:HTH-type transcriptional regulator/antitoxin HigA
MITNELQLTVSRQSLDRLIATMASLPEHARLFASIEKSAIKSQCVQLEKEITEYNKLKSGVFLFQPCISYDDLPRLVIAARIASGCSQKEIADRIKISEKLLQQYETSNFFGVSFIRINKIVEVLGYHFDKVFQGDGSNTDLLIFDKNESDSLDWGAFPAKEMAKRGWLTFKNKAKNTEDEVRRFYLDAVGVGLTPSYHRKTSHNGRSAKDYSLLAWEARVLSKADEVLHSSSLPFFQLDDSWLPELMALSLQDKGPILAREFLANKGIILIIENHLPGTYLDGAAMLSESGNPVIGMTLRLNRLDNFWFVLMHELGHVFKHLLVNLGVTFIDEKVGENGDCDDVFEVEADFFAQEILIPNEKWKKCISRVMRTDKALLGDAKRHGIHVAIIAGRLRREKCDYSLFSEFVGQGQVRQLFF